jgi:hypothetical protein
MVGSIPPSATANADSSREANIAERLRSRNCAAHEELSVNCTLEDSDYLTLELKLRGGQGVALAAVGGPAAPAASANRWAAGHRDQSASL